MKVAVVGLWHLGSVTAACLASAGHSVTGLDPDPQVVANLKLGKPPLFEPGLEELVKSGLSAGRLSFSTHAAEAVPGADVVWITYDTPVDENDVADTQSVTHAVESLFAHLSPGTLVLVSSQLPVGTIRRREEAIRSAFPEKAVTFGYSPENLRLGKAIGVFMQPDRVVVGVRTEADRSKVKSLLAPITDRIEFMSVESAEMTKHALNSFLAVSVTFINEIATLCEHVGADAKEVERGLKTEQRIGPKAYLGPGAAFAGGTLARDVAFLQTLGQSLEIETPLMDGIRASNDRHKEWANRRLCETLGDLDAKRIAILGLTYKPGTDTLRRSSAVELARALAFSGAAVVAFDPAVKSLPSDLSGIALANSAAAAINGANAVVLATEWPEFRDLRQDVFLTLAAPRVILDATSFLLKTLPDLPKLSGVRYLSVGRP